MKKNGLLVRVITLTTTALALLGIGVTAAPAASAAAVTSYSQARNYRSLSAQLKHNGLRNVRNTTDDRVWATSKQNFVYENTYFGKSDLTVSIMDYPNHGTSKSRSVYLYHLLTAALSQINSSGANINLKYVGDGVSSADIKVYYADNQHNYGLASDAVSQEIPRYWPNSINYDAQVDFRYASKYTTETTIIHEIGHALGLGHTDLIHKTTVMSAYFNRSNPNYTYYNQALIKLYGRK